MLIPFKYPNLISVLDLRLATAAFASSSPAGRLSPKAKKTSTGKTDLFCTTGRTLLRRSLVSIPAVLRDYQIAFFTFSFSWKGYGSLDLRQDLRYLPILRSDGSLIDYAVNLVSARWEDETVPVVVGEHRDIPLTPEPTFLQGPDGLFEATIRLNAIVREMIYFGYLPIVEMRGLKSELKDVTHAAKGFTTAPVNPEKISREWQKIESIEQLAVKPIMRFTFKSTSARFEPNP